MGQPHGPLRRTPSLPRSYRQSGIPILQRPTDSHCNCSAIIRYAKKKIAMHKMELLSRADIFLLFLFFSLCVSLSLALINRCCAMSRCREIHLHRIFADRGTPGVRSTSAIDLQAAQRAKARLMYANMSRQKAAAAIRE